MNRLEEDSLHKVLEKHATSFQVEVFAILFYGLELWTSPVVVVVVMLGDLNR